MTYNLASRGMIHCDYDRGCRAFYDAGNCHLNEARLEAAQHGWQTNQSCVIASPSTRHRRLDFCPEHRISKARKVFRPAAGINGWEPLHDYVRDALGGDYDRYREEKRAGRLRFRHGARGEFLVKVVSR